MKSFSSTEASSQKTSSSNTLDQNTTRVKIPETKCAKCDTPTEEPVYQHSWLCWKRASVQYQCYNTREGCTYTDIRRGKCVKHECYYCPYSSRCFICAKNPTYTTLDVHYADEHCNITYKTGTTVSSVREWASFLIDCDFGKAVCVYHLCGNDFELRINTPLPSEQLDKYKCTVEISHPDSGHTLVCTPTLTYTCYHDWYVLIPRTDFNVYFKDNMIKIKTDITKIEDSS